MPAPRKPFDYSPARNRPLHPEAYADQGSAVFFTVRAFQGRPFHENPDLCRMVVALLAGMRQEYGCWVGAYCLMPDHLHFVTGPCSEGRSVRVFLERFKGKSTHLSWQHGWSGRLWQSRAHDHVIRRAEAQEEIYAYVLENPVRAGLVADPEDWPWSGVLDPDTW